jgi:hypothetical protein
MGRDGENMDEHADFHMISSSKQGNFRGLKTIMALNKWKRNIMGK